MRYFENRIHSTKKKSFINAIKFKECSMQYKISQFKQKSHIYNSDAHLTGKLYHEFFHIIKLKHTHQTTCNLMNEPSPSPSKTTNTWKNKAADNRAASLTFPRRFHRQLHCWGHRPSTIVQCAQGGSFDPIKTRVRPMLMLMHRRNVCNPFLVFFRQMVVLMWPAMSKLLIKSNMIKIESKAGLQ